MKSKLAITSFILSLLPIIFLLTFFIIRVLSFGEVYLNLLWIVDGLIFFSFFWIVISFLSFVLGIIALFYIRKNNLGGKKFAVAGTVISATIFLIVIVLLISFVARGIPFA